MQIVLLKIIKNAVMHFNQLRNTGCKKPKNIIVGHLNINSLRNKFKAVEELVQNNVDICFSSEIKINKTFPTQQFMIIMVISSSSETEVFMVEAFHVIVMKISPPNL